MARQKRTLRVIRTVFSLALTRLTHSVPCGQHDKTGHPALWVAELNGCHPFFAVTLSGAKGLLVSYEMLHSVHAQRALWVAELNGCHPFFAVTLSGAKGLLISYEMLHFVHAQRARWAA
ncbi:MAG: hypothetical protein C0396_07900 [Anaerolinea sp.]|nr:hypothetical protein [Anaerolinea sp.]